MRAFLQNRWFRFSIWAALYVAWVIWLGNYWWLFGLVVVFDLFITKKVKWAFWKKNYQEGEKHNVFLDWLDAIIFAVLVVAPLNIFVIQAFTIPSSSMENSLMTGDYLFVSKLSYGPKVPQRPLSLPFVHNTIFGMKSYSDLIKLDYRRLAGFSQVKRDDIVVFGFPHGDSVLKSAPNEDYYTHVRMNGRSYSEKMYGPVITRPVDKKDNYVKRCVAVAGDTLQIIDGEVIVNSEKLPVHQGIQNTYRVVTDGSAINVKFLDEIGVSRSETLFSSRVPGYPNLPLTQQGLERLKSLPNVVDIIPNIEKYEGMEVYSEKLIFPFSSDYKWTRDNFGPLYIPKKGETVELTLKNLPLYRRIISVYEGHQLEVSGEEIFIDGNPSTTYTFEMDYYFMMGDNRHNSLDSRYWGFVPEDHIVGKPKFIWFSTDRNRSFPQSIRWNRLFKFV